MVKDLKLIHSQLERLTIDGHKIPQKIKGIPELLEHFESYDELVSDVQNGYWKILLPNHHLHTNYDLVTSKDIQKVDSRISKIMLIVPICLTIYGAVSGNYLLLLSIGVPIITNYIGAFFKGFLNGNFGYVLTFFASVVGFIIGNLSVVILFALSLLTLIVSQYIRNHRRKNIIYNCMNDEYIFCYLFFSGTISMCNSSGNIFVRHRFN
ncbi:hypothetical protein VR611_02090 [Aquirufa nivalisilvae]